MSPINHAFYTFFKPLSSQRLLKTQSLKNIILPSKKSATVSLLSSDYNENETESYYFSRTYSDFIVQLQPEFFYFLLKKAIIPDNWRILPGHLASFATNAASDIIEPSFLSLREDRQRLVPNLKIDYEHPKNGSFFTNSVYYNRYLSPQEELQIFLLKSAKLDDNNEGNTARGFLVGLPAKYLPFSIPELIVRIQNLKKETSDRYYFLLNGILSQDDYPLLEVEAFNCINPIYKQFGLVGTEPNPSPQMATWTLLKCFLGEKYRNQLIDDTGIRQPGIEKNYDDEFNAEDNIVTLVSTRRSS